jgi:signal peptidase II
MERIRIPALCFTLEWMAYYAIAAATNKIHGLAFLFFLIPALLLFLFAVAISSAVPGYRKRKWSVPIVFAILVAVDQGIKLLVTRILPAGTAVQILPDYYFLGWVRNDFGSWINSMLGMRASFAALSVLNAAVLVYAAAYYRYYEKKIGAGLWADCAAILMTAGCACSLIDKLAWGGSVDYIGLNGLFVTDLKDIFLSLSIGFIFTESFVNRKRNASVEDGGIRGIWDSAIDDARALFGARKRDGK